MVPLSQKPGIGTILKCINNWIMIDVCIKFVPTPENFISQIFLAISCSNSWIRWWNLFGCKFRSRTKRWINDRLQKKTNLPIAAVRATLEITVMSIGWYLGGTVGVGTLLFAFGIGPAVALSVILLEKFLIKVAYQTFHFFFYHLD